MPIKLVSREGEERVVELSEQILLGKGAHCDVVLKGWFMAREHARLFRQAEGVMIEDLGGGVQVNGRKVSLYGPLVAGVDEITLAGHQLVMLVGETGAMEGTVASPAHELVGETAREEALAASGQEDRDGLQALMNDWQTRLHERLLQRMDLRRKDISRMTDSELRVETEQLIREIVDEQRQQIPAQLEQEALIRRVLNEAVGYGPLEELLADDSISEIMVNRHDEIFVESRGRLTRHPLTFTSNQAVMAVIERIVAPIGRRIDESSPMVDARLRDGSRVNAIIPPLALKGPTLTIRKFTKRRLDSRDLVTFGSLSPDMAEFLRICVDSKKNIVVSGGTGSGKTTLLNVLSNFIPNGERIVTIEDAAELQLHHDHLVSLESRPANSEGKGQVAIRDLVKNSLRMRPDRIVIGECRGAEALDMLQAMNTGHEGSLTTLHANTPRDALSRLETLVMMAGMDLPLSAIREQIASAVDIIVQQTRFACGTRMITYITEITGMEGGRVQMQDIFRFRKTGYNPQGRIVGEFAPCDIVPVFYEDLLASGARFNLDMFKTDELSGLAV